MKSFNNDIDRSDKPSKTIGWLFVVVSFLFLIIGQLLNKQIATQFEGVSVERFTNGLFVLAFSLLIFRAYIWVLALKVIPLTKAYPVFSLSFPIVLIAAHYFFGESITLNNIIGSILLLFGVTLSVLK